MILIHCGFFFTEELVVYVKQELQNLGFLSKEFSLLPNDASSGSRELLLAFAWLLCKQNLVDKFMDNCSSPIEDASLLNEVQYCFKSKNKVRMQ